MKKNRRDASAVLQQRTSIAKTKTGRLILPVVPAVHQWSSYDSTKNMPFLVYWLLAGRGSRAEPYSCRQRRPLVPVALP